MGSMLAPTTTSPSRSRSRSCWPGSERSLRRRGIVLGRALAVGDLSLDRETREVARAGRPVELTPREFELLELFIGHPRQVFSREAILNRIWGYEYEGDANVIEAHISALREKLGDRDRTLIRSIRGVGYTLRG